MATGKSWPKEDANKWAELWWRSKRTSAEFVEVHQLPISSRSLRAHAERHLGEVLDELDAFRRRAVIEGTETALPAPGQVAALASASVPAVPLAVIMPDQVAVDVTALVPLPDGASAQGAEPDHLAGDGGAGRRGPKVPFDFYARADQVVGEEPSPAPSHEVLVDFWDLSAR